MYSPSKLPRLELQDMSERPEVKAVQSNIMVINSTITNNGNGVQWYAQKLRDEELIDSTGELGDSLEDCTKLNLLSNTEELIGGTGALGDCVDGPEDCSDGPTTFGLSSNTDPVAALAGKLTESVVTKLITTATPEATFKKYLGILGEKAGRLVKQIVKDYGKLYLIEGMSVIHCMASGY